MNKEVRSRFFCPSCGEDGELFLSDNGMTEYKTKKETNKYFCTVCCLFYRIDQSNDDFRPTNKTNDLKIEVLA